MGRTVYLYTYILVDSYGNVYCPIDPMGYTFSAWNHIFRLGIPISKHVERPHHEAQVRKIQNQRGDSLSDKANLVAGLPLTTFRLGFAWPATLRMEKVPNNILPNGGFFMVMNPMVESVKNHQQKQIPVGQCCGDIVD